MNLSARMYIPVRKSPSPILDRSLKTRVMTTQDLNKSGSNYYKGLLTDRKVGSISSSDTSDSSLPRTDSILETNRTQLLRIQTLEQQLELYQRIDFKKVSMNMKELEYCHQVVDATQSSVLRTLSLVKH